MGSDDLTLLGDGCGKAKEKLKYRYCLLCNAGKAKEFCTELHCLAKKKLKRVLHRKYFSN